MDVRTLARLWYESKGRVAIKKIVQEATTAERLARLRKIDPESLRKPLR